jgi:AraC family transcriptional regulator
MLRPEDYLYNVRPDGTASYLELNRQAPPLSSRDRAWEGIIVERDRFFPFDNGDVVYEEHFIGFVLDHGVHLSHAVDGRRYEGVYGPGDFILSPGEQPVNWRLDDASDALVVSIRPEVLKRTVQETTDTDPAKVQIIGQPRMRDRLITQIGIMLTAELEGPGIGERLYVDSLLNVLTLHLLRHYSSLARRPDSPTDRGLPKSKLQRAIEAINENLEMGISLNELAGATGLSVSHFEVLFKRSTGLSPHQYLLRCRVERAKELLQCEDFSLAQVAARTGFCDQSHLTRHFKRIVGITPRDFRTGA